MPDVYSPCSLHKHGDSYCLEYWAFDPSWNEALNDWGGQGGGISLEVVIHALREMRSLGEPHYDFQAAAGSFRAFSRSENDLEALASLIRELTSDRTLLTSAIQWAIDKGYFE